MSVWFITPAYKRFDLSAVCFDQRRLVMDRLAEDGIEARCVVVADDANLDLARERGFDTVEQDNEWLGRKFNDGIEYACRAGAEWIVPIGSDSWIDPAYLLPLPSAQVTRTSPLYCAVTSERLAELSVQSASGAGPYMIHRRRLMRSGFRPAGDYLKRYIDHSTIRGIGTPDWRRRNVHALQYIGFRHPTTFITSYEALASRWATAEHMDPWVRLATVYPADLVERARLALCVLV